MRYKIIHIYMIDAYSRKEAMSRFAQAVKEGKEDEYFQSEIVKLQEEDVPSWMQSFKKQVTGK